MPVAMTVPSLVALAVPSWLVDEPEDEVAAPVGAAGGVVDGGVLAPDPPLDGQVPYPTA